MPQFCKNGHQMEEGWSECFYCMRTGFRTAATAQAGKTRPEMGATRPDVGLQPQPQSAAAFDGAKTVPLAAIKRAPVVGWLVALSGPLKGEDFRLREGKNSIGTGSEVSVRLQDPAVSHLHASLNYKDGKFLLTDLDSTNGTFVNDESEAAARAELKDGDTIRVGETALKFKCL